MGGLRRQCGDAGLLVALWRSGRSKRPVRHADVRGLGFFGSTFPIVIGHAPRLLSAASGGRGVTLVNLFGIASVGIAQR
jgi:hypothetical protein